MEVGPWADTVDATEDGALCPQFDISHNEPIGDEDCLSLNVYTPKMDSKKRAVMVGNNYFIFLFHQIPHQPPTPPPPS